MRKPAHMPDAEILATLVRAGIHPKFDRSMPDMFPSACEALARRLAAMEKVVEAARDALTIHEDVACSCRGCQRIRTALAALDESEVGGGR